MTVDGYIASQKRLVFLIFLILGTLSLLFVSISKEVALVQQAPILTELYRVYGIDETITQNPLEVRELTSFNEKLRPILLKLVIASIEIRKIKTENGEITEDQVNQLVGDNLSLLEKMVGDYPNIKQSGFNFDAKSENFFQNISQAVEYDETVIPNAFSVKLRRTSEIGVECDAIAVRGKDSDLLIEGIGCVIIKKIAGQGHREELFNTFLIFINFNCFGE